MDSLNYSNEFYDRTLKGSLDSARLILGYLFTSWVPDSVVDVGCGRGTWLAICKELGVKRLVGFDGSWVTQEMMLDPAIEFRSVNLADEGVVSGFYDLALSMEVAEHLPPEASDKFISTLVRVSNAVLFSAAFVAQPGTNHINTRPHSFWAKKFLANGYLLFDIFRQEFWDNEKVEPWYRQNTFLYVKPVHPLHDALIRDGHRVCKNVGFVDCIHPWLYSFILDQLINIKRPLPAAQIDNPTSSLRRNELCPCGSGKKYKHCHGRVGIAPAR
jgi:SAM-dependent methyltransferase